MLLSISWSFLNHLIVIGESPEITEQIIEIRIPSSKLSGNENGLKTEGAMTLRLNSISDRSELSKTTVHLYKPWSSLLIDEMFIFPRPTRTCRSSNGSLLLSANGKKNLKPNHV